MDKVERELIDGEFDGAWGLTLSLWDGDELAWTNASGEWADDRVELFGSYEEAVAACPSFDELDELASRCADGVAIAEVCCAWATRGCVELDVEPDFVRIADSGAWYEQGGRRADLEEVPRPDAAER